LNFLGAFRATKAPDYLPRAMNLTDPIIPGSSAGGITLDDSAKDLIQEQKPDIITTRSLWDRFQFKGITVWAEPGSATIYQIAVSSPYVGKVENGLRIGISLFQVEQSIGNIEIGEYDQILIPGCKGLGIELSDDTDDPRVTHIIVFDPQG